MSLENANQLSQEKSQEELRAILEQELGSLKTKILENIADYKDSLNYSATNFVAGNPGVVAATEIRQGQINYLIEKAEKIKAELDSGEQLEQTKEKYKTIFEITPDPEITSAETAITKLEKEGHKIADDAKYILTKVDWKEKLKNSYEIVSVSIGELFNDNEVHSYADIKAKAGENSLDLVPASLAPSIRLNYEKSGKYTVLAMEAIRDREFFKLIFSCGMGEGHTSWLSRDFGDDNRDEWNDDERFLFVRK